MNEFKYIKHKPRINMRYQTNKVTDWSGSIGLMCPNCMNIVKANITYQIRTYDILDKVESLDQCIEYYGECLKCHESVHFEIIDTNMIDIIEILNDKGYYTAYCCEGHIEGNKYDSTEEFTPPYIYFYLSDDIKILNKYPLPKTWYIDDYSLENNIFVIRDHIIEELDESIEDDKEIVEWFKNNWKPENSMEDLYEWAKSLPKKDNYIRTAQFEFIKKYGKVIIQNNAKKL